VPKVVTAVSAFTRRKIYNTKGEWIHLTEKVLGAFARKNSRFAGPQGKIYRLVEAKGKWIHLTENVQGTFARQICRFADSQGKTDGLGEWRVDLF
jgi:hypothetical protein